MDSARTVTPSSARIVLVEESSRLKPKTVDRLNDWQYVERTIHRLLAAWGRHIADWDDKSALHQHVWEQAESVHRLRARVREFPGGKPDAPVSARLERLGNMVLQAPTANDAIDGIYNLLLMALVNSYVEYATQTHPVHDAPTARMLHGINQTKSQQWMWYRDFRRRNPHVTDRHYAEKIAAALADCKELKGVLPVDGEARPVGVGLDFRLPRFSARSAPTAPKYDFMPYVRADFRTSLEARRLFWAYAYLLEKNIPDDQLRWIFDGYFMPWDWHYDVSRHLWDESRHGDSGYSRLQDFGITLEDVGFPAYDQAEAAANVGQTWAPLDPKELYENVFFIGMVAENAHFVVKNEAYQDFREGRDLESAEMMLFDIIDETAHVQYAHRWLPVLAEKAGMSNEGYRERAARVRVEWEAGETSAIGKLDLPRQPGYAPYDFYQELLARIRSVAPLANAQDSTPRSPKPM
jgi:hypothetical protein